MKSINNFIIGQEAQLTQSYSESDVEQFTNISGDHNPIHTNEAYAKTTRFGSRIVYGFLSGSLISVVLGNELYGGCGFGVFSGYQLHAMGTICWRGFTGGFQTLAPKWNM